jgi:hypothetical protein
MPYETVRIYFYTENMFPAVTEMTDILVHFHTLENKVLQKCLY